MDQRIRILIADDHPVVRGGLAALFGTLDGIEVVAEAADGEAAVREALLTRPDVVVLDLRMPKLDGIAVIRQLAVDMPQIVVLVLTMFDEDALVLEALEAGARGYLLKGAEPEEIERAVRAVAAGATVLASQVAARAVHGRAAVLEPFPTLTAREREILDHIARGLPNAVIAGRLGIAGKTVGNHISAIFLKVGVATRSEAIVLARDAGLGS